MPHCRTSLGSASRASEYSEKDRRKSIEATDITKALTTSGFEGYATVFKKALEESTPASTVLEDDKEASDEDYPAKKKGKADDKDGDKDKDKKGKAKKEDTPT